MHATAATIFRKELKSQLTSHYQPREADQIAALIVEHLFESPTTSQLLANEIHVSKQIERQAQQIISRLLQHEPIQYVLGYTEFYGRRYKTDPRALIPRPETEELVHFILAEGIRDKSRILDIGTGTGCIAITLALETKSNVYALDIDQTALALAKENASLLVAPINFMQEDILSTRLSLPNLDLIVSNPPYVPQKDLAAIDSRVKDFEPTKAVIVPDEDPLIFYQRIAQLATEYLSPGGRVYLEIYHLAGSAISALFQPPQWSQVLVKKDLQGKDRMIRATLNTQS